MQIETERLILRYFKREDAKALYQCASDKKVGPLAGWTTHKDEAYSLGIIEKVLLKPYSFAIFLKEDMTLIGGVEIEVGEDSTLYIYEDEAEISYWLNSNYWHQGLMSEALVAAVEYSFNNYAINTFYAASFVYNIPSLK